MEIKAFIMELKGRKDLREIVHHEEIPAVAASYSRPVEPLPHEITDALSLL